MKPAMGDPTQQDPGSSSVEPATSQQPGDPPAGPASIDHVPGMAMAPASASLPGTGTLPDDAGADLDDDDPVIADEALDPAVHEAMVENLIARVLSVRQQWSMLERERHDLRRALRRVERERDELRAEHERALRRAEAAELELADVQSRIAALADSLQQRRRGPGTSAKLPGPDHDVG
jgi:hypothetical protein